MDGEECKNLQRELESRLGEMIFPFDDKELSFFDLPSGYRTLIGFIRTANYMVRESPRSAIRFDHNNENLFLLWGCNEINERIVMLNPVPNDQFELSGMQNFADILFPFNNVFDISNVKEFTTAMTRLDFDWLIPFIKDIHPKEREEVRMTQDMKLLEKVTTTRQLQKPGVFTEHDKEEFQDHDFKLDHTALRQNMFFQFTDAQGDTTVVLPVEFEVKFNHKITGGVFSRFGRAQETYTKLEGLRMTLHPCVTFKKPKPGAFANVLCKNINFLNIEIPKTQVFKQIKTVFRDYQGYQYKNMWE